MADTTTRQTTARQAATGQTTTGQCLCGAIRYAIGSPLRPVSLCHCGQCRRWHGHAGAYTNVPRAALQLKGEASLKWYRSSDTARRGFCADCGSLLFWDAPDRDTISVTAGSLDAPTRTEIGVQIFTEDKGDYYNLDPSVPIRPKAVAPEGQLITACPWGPSALR
jgi:hypothetical protein